jgi:hypothetical protein
VHIARLLFLLIQARLAFVTLNDIDVRQSIRVRLGNFRAPIICDEGNVNSDHTYLLWMSRCEKSSQFELLSSPALDSVSRHHQMSERDIPAWCRPSGSEGDLSIH